jgi:hypothetical protein
MVLVNLVTSCVERPWHRLQTLGAIGINRSLGLPYATQLSPEARYENRLSPRHGIPKPGHHFPRMALPFLDQHLHQRF